MTYFIHEVTYAILRDGTLEWRDESNGKFVDHAGNALDTAEAAFYAKIADELETAIMFGNNLLAHQQNRLHVQEWFLDEAHTMRALHIEISEHQLMHNLSVGVDNPLPEIDEELRTATLLHEEELKPDYEDIAMKRERLYRANNGTFILVCARKDAAPAVKWHQEKKVIGFHEAAAWGKRHMSAWMYNQLFAFCNLDEDLVPTSFMLEKSTVAALHQLAKTTNRTEGEIVQAALSTYLK
ncbi:MAG: hypothetical protein IJZ68_07895 [Bacteroidaceae bacterium]|nr:hypothetical protein [Bacteroidaceae bacterium]